LNNKKLMIAAVDGIATTTTTFSSPFFQYGLVPDGATSLLVPQIVGHQRLLDVGDGTADDRRRRRQAGLVNTIVSPGHAVIGARKAAREICALPVKAVAISRKLLLTKFSQFPLRT